MDEFRMEDVFGEHRVPLVSWTDDDERVMEYLYVEENAELTNYVKGPRDDLSVESCSRYDAPFPDDAPDSLKKAAGVLIYAYTTYDEWDEDEDSGLSIDAEDLAAAIYDNMADLEHDWSQTVRKYAASPQSDRPG